MEYKTTVFRDVVKTFFQNITFITNVETLLRCCLISMHRAASRSLFERIQELFVLLLEARLLDGLVAENDEERVEARVGEAGGEALVEEPIALLAPQRSQDLHGRLALFGDLHASAHDVERVREEVGRQTAKRTAQALASQRRHVLRQVMPEVA